MKNNKEEVINLIVSIGKDELGNDLIIDIPKLSHILIAGVAGSGKSNLLHRIISTLSSLISPNDLKLVLVDLKKIELNVYNNLPHLLTQVITDTKKAISALKWVGKEMERRLDMLQSENVRNIVSYHNKGPKKDTMPYILIVVDGLAEMMAEYPEEVETVISKLTQTSHLVGIHLIFSTSRLANKVITEPIKSGIQSRIAFRVSTASDSISILGTGGAEKLDVAGEILFQSRSMKYPICARLSLISESEIKENLKMVNGKYKEAVSKEVSLVNKQGSIFSENAGDGEDDLYGEALEAVTTAGKASTSFLQRKLRIGYARSARLMDILEDAGVIGAGRGAEPRKVLKRPSDTAKEK